MQKKFFLTVTFGFFIFFLTSFKAETHLKKSVNSTKQTTTEFGEFTYGGTVYGVYGDATTNTITEVDFFWTGVPVSSFSGTYTPAYGTKQGGVPASVSLSVYTTTSNFSYSGPLAFY